MSNHRHKHKQKRTSGKAKAAEWLRKADEQKPGEKEPERRPFHDLKRQDKS